MSCIPPLPLTYLKHFESSFVIIIMTRVLSTFIFSRNAQFFTLYPLGKTLSCVHCLLDLVPSSLHPSNLSTKNPFSISLIIPFGVVFCHVDTVISASCRLSISIIINPFPTQEIEGWGWHFSGHLTSWVVVSFFST